MNTKRQWKKSIGIGILGILMSWGTGLGLAQAGVPTGVTTRRGVAGASSSRGVWHPVRQITPRRRVARAVPISQITAGIQRFYQGVKTLCTNFQQEFKPARFTRKQKANGQFFYKKPGMLRFFYKKPEAKHYIYNGSLQTLWMYYPEDSEVKVRQKVSRAQFGLAFQFLWGGGKLEKTFRIKKIKGAKFGQRGDIRLELIPKKPQNLFKKLYFVVIPGSYQIRETIYTDPAGNLNRFIFSGMKLNTKCRLKSSMFNFQVPKGVKVIRQ